MIQQVTFRFPSLGVDLQGASTYTITRTFGEGQPCTIDIEIGDNRALELLQALQLGTKVQALVGNNLQGTFFIEKLHQSTGSLSIQGRDQMGFIADSHISTHVKFAPGMSVKSVVETVLKTMPIAGKPLSVLSSDAGKIKAISDSSGEEDTSPDPIPGVPLALQLPSLLLNSTSSNDSPPPKSEIGEIACSQLKIKRGEQALEFLRKFIARFNLLMWASADGESLIISTPSYYSTAYQRLIRGANGNVEHGEISFSLESQPSFIYAAGRGASNDFDHAPIKVFKVNEFLGTDQDFNVKPEIYQFIQDNPDLKDCTEIGLIPELKDFRFLLPDLAGYPMKPAFLVDNNANTEAELTNFVREKLARFRRECIELNYIVAGHADRGMPWTTNRMVAVQDDRLNVNCAFFCAACKFSQSREHGTRTELKLIPPFSI